jgi:hypothetical protein
MSLAAGIEGRQHRHRKLVAAFKGLQVDTRWARISYRAQDNQSTMGAYVGVTTRNRRQGRHGGFPLPRRQPIDAPDAVVAQAPARD